MSKFRAPLAFLAGATALALFGTSASALEYKLKEVLVSGVIANGNPSSADELPA